MSLKDKYTDLLKLGEELKISGSKWTEEGGKPKLWGTAEYQLQKDKLWDKIKTYSGGENDLVADIKVEKTDVYGYYTVKPGDSLSKITKDVYDNANIEDLRGEQGPAQEPGHDPPGPEARPAEQVGTASSRRGRCRRRSPTRTGCSFCRKTTATRGRIASRSPKLIRSRSATS